MEKRMKSTMDVFLNDHLLERILGFVEDDKDRNVASVVCKSWFVAEAWTRQRVFIGNCYALTPEFLVRRFTRVTSLRMKGKPRFSDFNMVPPRWGAEIMPWLKVLAEKYTALEELRLKRMVVTDESLRFIARSFSSFKVLSLSTCEGFSTEGLAAITTHCRNLTELDLHECEIEDRGGFWLSFPESSNSLEILNFACVHGDIDVDSLERLVARCKSLKSLKLNKNVSLEQLRRLLVKAPQLVDLGTGPFSEELTQYEDLELAFRNCKRLKTLSFMWDMVPQNLCTLYCVCANLTFLNLSYTQLGSLDLAKLVDNCRHLQRLWVLDSVQDEGLQSVSSSCRDLRELRVFPDPYGEDPYGVTEKGILAISQGCPKLSYVLYFCKQMTNAAIASVVKNCPNFTHFRLCIMNPFEPDHLTKGPMDEAFGEVVKNCKNLQRLSVSGLLTDKAFEYIGNYAKNLEALSVAFAGTSDWGMECVLKGCPKLRKLEIRDSPFGNKALLSGLECYESMRSLWMSSCHVTMDGCRELAQRKPMLNVEVMKKDENDEHDAEKVYLYRTIAGPRKDAPDFVLTL